MAAADGARFTGDSVGSESDEVVGEARLHHPQLDRLGDRYQPQMSGVPVRMEAVERQITRVAVPSRLSRPALRQSTGRRYRAAVDYQPRRRTTRR